MKLKNQIIVAIIAVLGSLASCDTFKDDVTGGPYAEDPKPMDGVWQLKTVSRNGSDITHTMNFSQFRIHMNADSTYVIENYMPFVVKKNGKWSVDDPYYPFFLTFYEEGKTTPAKVQISYPVVSGSRNITLTVSPGCYSNSYVYSFERVENE